MRLHQSFTEQVVESMVPELFDTHFIEVIDRMIIAQKRKIEGDE